MTTTRICDHFLPLLLFTLLLSLVDVIVVPYQGIKLSELALIVAQVNVA